MNEKLVFFEFEDEARPIIDFLFEKGIGLENVTFIPLSLGSQLALKREKITYVDTLHYFDKDSHKVALSQSEKWLRLMEENLDANDVLFRELIFQFRFVINYFLWMSHVVVTAIEQHRPSHIICPSKKPRITCSHKLASDDRFLGSMIARYAENESYTVSCVGNSDVTSQETSGRTDHSEELKNPNGLSSKVINRYCRRSFKNKSVVLVASKGYGLDRAIKDPRNIPDVLAPVFLDFESNPGGGTSTAKVLFRFLRDFIASKRRMPQSMIPVHFFPLDTSSLDLKQKEAEEVIENLAERIEGEWKDVFMYKGFNASSYFAEKMRRGIKLYIKELVLESGRLRSVFKATRPRALLSPFSAGVYAVLGDMCQKLDIPAVLIPHGSLAPPKDMYEEIEWYRLSQAQMLSTYTFVISQTPLAAEHADYFHMSEKSWPTGPILFARKGNNKEPKWAQTLPLDGSKRIIVYAVAQRKRSSTRFLLFETEDEYHSSMSDVVKAVNQVKNAHLILKLHPSVEYSESQLRQILPDSDHVTILKREPFREVLEVADLLVSYYSTTVEEAVLSRIPVVLFDKWKRFSFLEVFDCSSLAPKEWKPDVGYYVNRADRLPQVLSFALRHADQVAKNDRFYSKYNFPKDRCHPLAYYLGKLSASREI